MPGRFNGQRFFLTYPQADAIDIDDLADYLHALADSWLEIVQEVHQEEFGGIHYHVVLCFTNRFQGPLDSFDFGGKHPHWDPIKNATTQLNNFRHYIRKGARPKKEEHPIKDHKTKACDYIIDPDTRGEVPLYAPETGRLNWGGILAAAVDRDSFLQLVRHSQPKDWVLRHDAILKFATTNYPDTQVPERIYPAESWNVPPVLDEWVNSVFSEVCFIPARSHVPPFVY